MKRFIVYVVAFLSPMLLMLIYYVVFDPFKALWHYDVYYEPKRVLPVNSSLVSAMTYANQRDKYHYDSFIFENSRSLFYEVEEWQKHLHEYNACFHFWHSNGSIKSWHDKVRFIDENNDTIRNALCVLDHEMLSTLNNDSWCFALEAPILDHNSNWLSFQISHFRAFCDLKLVVSLVDYAMFGQYRSYMKRYIKDSSQKVSYDRVTHESRKLGVEEQIAAGTFYTAKRMKVFDGVQRPGEISSHILTSEERFLIREIREVFDKHNTNYEIVLGPQYDQIRLNENTMSFLYETFGREHVHDFTGVNKWTSDYHNYYENSHYRPHVAKEIMELVYDGSSFPVDGCK